MSATAPVLLPGTHAAMTTYLLQMLFVIWYLPYTIGLGIVVFVGQTVACYGLLLSRWFVTIHGPSMSSAPVGLILDSFAHSSQSLVERCFVNIHGPSTIPACGADFGRFRPQ